MKLIDIVFAIVLVSMSGLLVGVDARDIVRYIASSDTARPV
ncbi:hypothetical protein [Sphaerotilus mobilis]|uniref:Uncharacterized protein n=1 Tax=Sphaerotilus mobilis TaxID=47994 RepID=A0A4Q7LI01_9BURK|nr:hypothetical protein [Sphaerotilus mobilis]RZS53377.1 hypothetical protein EV685_3005 [Sphaerotilus mobilis]